MTFLVRHHGSAGCFSIEALCPATPLALALVLLLLIFGCSKETAGSSPPAVVHAQAAHVCDLAGHAVNPLDTTDTKAIVLIFVATECPISNRYAPEIRRLAHKFAQSGVRFWLVYVDPETPPAAIRDHLKTYNLSPQALRDPKHELVRLSRVHVTPETAVFVPGPRLVYHGRIDDRYADLGKDRLEATQHDLERVVEAILHGQPAPEAAMRAIGCYISDAE
jgi:hypothetical protein